jgi:hypothetical protein
MEPDHRPAFSPGVPGCIASRKRRRPTPLLNESGVAHAPAFCKWEDRPPVAPGLIRILTPPTPGTGFLFDQWHWLDGTLTHWHCRMDETEESIQKSTFCRAMYPADYMERVRALFTTNQRRRMLFRCLLARLRYRIWSRRPACNVDLISLEPIPPADVIEMIDTGARTLFRFSRNDVHKTLMSNITLSDEMLPMPRAPRNPYTNAPLTLAQTIAICHRLVAHTVRRGGCPPPLLAAFWAARFDIKRFHDENTAALSQYAIREYFAEINDDNIYTVYQTILTLMSFAGRFPTTRRGIDTWLRTRPLTLQHTAWLELCRDYTLYLNLHVQSRPHWYDETAIRADTLALMHNTPFPRMAPLILPPPPPLPSNPLSPLLSPVLASLSPLSLLLQPQPSITTTLLDISGNMTTDEALQLIQDALLRL